MCDILKIRGVCYTEMWLIMFYFESILQIWIILIGFRDTNEFVNLGICKHEFKFTCRGYCRFTLRSRSRIAETVDAWKGQCGLRWLIKAANYGEK